jgi:predicted RNase H-like nuclease (RuvC/YqgF family)
MRFDAHSELHKAQFKRACDSAGVSMSNVLRDAMDAFIHDHTPGTDPDSLERQAVELERTVEELRSNADQLHSEREQILTEAESILFEAEQLRREAYELRMSTNNFEGDVEELAEYLTENPKLRVFSDHAKVTTVAQAHEKTPEQVLEALVAYGVSETRVIGDI